MSCECAENNQTKPTAVKQALHDWLDEGGKVFASHYHYTWFRDSPAADFQGVAQWGNSGGNDTASGGGHPYDVDTTFPKGATFGQWLGVVGALNSSGPPPDVVLNQVADSVVAVNPPTARWIYDSQGAPDVKYMSFGTPIGGAPPPPDAGPESSGKQYCGKAVFTDLHTGGSLTSTVASIPAGCKGQELSEQQKALEFLFFDRSACVTNDLGTPPVPPSAPLSDMKAACGALGTPGQPLRPLPPLPERRGRRARWLPPATPGALGCHLGWRERSPRCAPTPAAPRA